jgi:hypothetical protein
MKLGKIGHHRVESDEGWSVDTSSFLDLIYRDGDIESAITMEGAGTFFSPSDVWLSTMRVRNSDGPMEAPNELRALIEKRAVEALGILKLRFKQR